VAGERRLDRHFGGIGIADLADDDHIRVLADDVAQGFLKGEVDLGIDRALGHPLDHVLHRLLGGDDAHLGGLLRA
jgi:hypothetical protein